MIYALAHFTKLKPTIDLVKCHYIKAEEITQFHQRNQMISENDWNVLMRIEVVYTYLHFSLMHSWALIAVLLFHLYTFPLK